MRFYGLWAGWWWIWWIIWTLIIVWIFAWWIPGSRREVKMTPLELLQYRLARGELSVEEYEQRKAILERDSTLPPPRSR
ncbi:MAG: hypothetical protein ACRD01_00850 [Terriglobales bacterium]